MTTKNTSWIDHAICKGKTRLFFTSSFRETQREKVKRERIAMTYCRQCPVQIECRDYARENNELGVWGGENEEMRWKAGYMRGAATAVRRRYIKRFGREVQQQTDDQQMAESDSIARS